MQAIYIYYATNIYNLVFLFVFMIKVKYNNQIAQNAWIKTNPKSQHTKH